MSRCTPDVPAVLARHGVPASADAAALLAALEARGWRGTLEEPPTDEPAWPRGARRFRALAFRRSASAGPRRRAIDRRRATG